MEPQLDHREHAELTHGGCSGTSTGPFSAVSTPYNISIDLVNQNNTTTEAKSRLIAQDHC